MIPYHEPVMLREVVDGLCVGEGKLYIDATIGGAGHACEIVRRGGVLLGIDADGEAVLEARKALGSCAPGGNWTVVRGNFRDIEIIARNNTFFPADGVVFDLGVSSHQLDAGNRGFSYRHRDALLDGRFDASKGPTIRERINECTKEQLYEILAQFGEEKHSRAISHAFVGARRLGGIQTAGDLDKVIGTVVQTDRERIKTLTRVLQAFRIDVNDELGALQEGLRGAVRIVRPGGRVAVISFHSLEDRIVKRFIASEGSVRAVGKKPQVPAKDEIGKNRRAKSAKLRIFERITE